MSAALVRAVFGDESLYDILGVTKDATEAQLRRGYYKKALQWVGDALQLRAGGQRGAALARRRLMRTPRAPLPAHTPADHPHTRAAQHPDRAGNTPEATQRFQALGFVHSILCDAHRRAAYDAHGLEEGAEEDGGGGEAGAAWYDYWRGFFPAATEEDVIKFEAEYRGR